MMLSYSTINQLSVFLIIVSGLYLAFWVYLANRKEKASQAFFVFTIFLVAWTSFPFFFNLPNISSELATLLVRLAYGTTALFLIPFYYFVVYFPSQHNRHFLLDKIVFMAGILLFLISALTNLLVKGIEIKNWGVSPIFGPGKVLYFILMLSIALSIVVMLLKKYFVLPKNDRVKIQYVLIGISIFIFLNAIFNVLLPLWLDNLRYYPLGNYSAIILIILTAYAIVKKQLFDIKVVLTELLVGLIAILLLVNFAISNSLLEYIWKGFLLIAFMVAGVLLVLSIRKEIKQREKLDKLATELSVVNIRLEGAYDKLQKLDKAKSEFLSIASHQLRAPLTAVKGYVSMMQEGDYGKVPTKMTKPLNNVYDSNERLVNLVNSLLDISRIEAGKIKYEEGEFSMADLLNDIVNEFKMRAETKGLYLNLEIPKPKPANIKGDSAKLRQVVSNLIDNAIKYTEKGGLKVSLQTEPAKTRIVVEDTGEGIEKEDLPKLFQTFSRASAGTKLWTEGTGLGLYVARKFIEMHKGKIRAESPGRGKGSKFVIELPVK